MFTDTLKEKTMENHQQLEKLLVGRMKQIRIKQQYVDLLQLFYTYFEGLEQQIKPFINEFNFPDYSKRRKADLLETDINSLGATTNALAASEDLPGINNEFDAYGALYVIEGSTLGGKIISAMMAKHLNLADGKGVSFFTGYGDDTENMWQEFKQTLNRLTGENQDERVIEAANHTFSKFKLWVEKMG
jgi:heme oxygenase